MKKYLIFGFFLTACDPAYRIRRTALKVSEPIPTGCIQKAVEKLEGFSVSKYQLTTPNKNCASPSEPEYYMYLNAGKEVAIEACFEKNKMKSFSQSYGRLGILNPEIDKSVTSIMQKVETSVAQTCQISNFENLVRREK